MAWTALAAWLKTMQTSVQNLTLYVIDNLNYLKGRTDAYDTHDHSASDPTAVDHANLANVSANQHHNQSHGVGDHTDRNRFLFLPFVYSSSGCVGIGVPVAGGMNLRNSEHDRAYTPIIPVPEDFVSWVDSMLIWSHDASPSGNGWYLQALEMEYMAYEETGGTTQSAVTPIGQVAATSGAVHLHHVHTGLTLAPVLGDFLSWSIQRDGDHASDDWDLDAHVLGILMEYVSDE